MNPRIRELAEEAGITTNLDTDWFDTDPNKWVEYFSEKFAELIVRKCVDICHKLAEDSDSYVVHDGDTCAKQIKEHFGVEP